MRIYRCWFCSSPIYPGHGTLFVRNDCKEFRFCRGKCHKAFKKHRNPRKVKWTKVSRKALKKELVDDLSQTFERKRNTLLRYERDALVNTVTAVPKIESIKHKRESAFIKKRLLKGFEQRKAEDIKLVKTQMHLIETPNTKEKRKRSEMDDDEMSSSSSEKEEEEEVMDISMNSLEKEVESEKVKKPARSKAPIQKKLKILLRA